MQLVAQNMSTPHPHGAREMLRAVKAASHHLPYKLLRITQQAPLQRAKMPLQRAKLSGRGVVYGLHLRAPHDLPPTPWPLSPWELVWA